MERGSVRERPVRVPSGTHALEGMLGLPEAAQGIVLFAHGSGSSRFSPRNRLVARFLHEAAFVTLLIDLLTAEEDEVDQVTRRLRFDIPLLGRRLIDILDWMAADAAVRALPIGLFGASTGAAAALIAAAQRPKAVQAIVSRGGRPDLVVKALAQVRAPTLLIVGADDDEVLRLNRQALTHLQVEKTLEIVPGATHLFEEPGALERVADLAAVWFKRYLIPNP